MTDKSYTVCLVPPERCREEWNRVRILLLPAIKRTNGRWDEAFLLASLVMNEQSLWVVLDQDGQRVGAVTTEIIEYPLKRVFALNFTGGKDWDEWNPEAFRIFNKFAVDAGCDLIEFTARDGFWKWFKKDGFERTSSFYEKRINK
jgi:hypothetical protein